MRDETAQKAEMRQMRGWELRPLPEIAQLFRVSVKTVRRAGSRPKRGLEMISWGGYDIISLGMEQHMPQIVVRQLSDEVHRALKARASEHGRSTEAEARDIIAHAVLPDTRPKAGDLLCGIWRGADVSGVTFERDKTPHSPMSFE